jgi:hypothetical protein
MAQASCQTALLKPFVTLLGLESDTCTPRRSRNSKSIARQRLNTSRIAAMRLRQFQLLSSSTVHPGWVDPLPGDNSHVTSTGSHHLCGQKHDLIALRKPDHTTQEIQPSARLPNRLGPSRLNELSTQ